MMTNNLKDNCKRYIHTTLWYKTVRSIAVVTYTYKLGLHTYISSLAHFMACYISDI